VSGYAPGGPRTPLIRRLRGGEDRRWQPYA
jgi:hypothetical protein